jgi:hypothetical protein
MPFTTMMNGAAVMGLADGPTEAHKMMVAKQVLRDGGSQNEIYEISRGSLHCALRIPPPSAPPGWPRWSTGRWARSATPSSTWPGSSSPGRRTPAAATGPSAATSA